MSFFFLNTALSTGQSNENATGECGQKYMQIVDFRSSFVTDERRIPFLRFFLVFLQCGSNLIDFSVQKTLGLENGKTRVYLSMHSTDKSQLRATKKKIRIRGKKIFE